MNKKRNPAAHGSAHRAGRSSHAGTIAHGGLLEQAKRLVTVEELAADYPGLVTIEAQAAGDQGGRPTFKVTLGGAQ